MTTDDAAIVAQQGYLELGKVLTDDEVERFVTLFDEDRHGVPYFWHHYGHHQSANYDALISTPQFDHLIRHEKILPRIEALMGDPVCFGEIGLRHMKAYHGEYHQAWHRDKAHLAQVTKLETWQKKLKLTLPLIQKLLGE